MTETITLETMLAEYRDLRGEVARLKNLLRAFAVARTDQLPALKKEAKELLK